MSSVTSSIIVAPESHLGRSWLLLLGIIPFDYDDIGIVELEADHRLLERSSMLSMKFWEHERTITSSGEGCELRDQVAFELRGLLSVIPALAKLLRHLLRRLFRHRHGPVVRYFWRAPPNTRI